MVLASFFAQCPIERVLRASRQSVEGEEHVHRCSKKRRWVYFIQIVFIEQHVGIEEITFTKVQFTSACVQEETDVLQAEKLDRSIDSMSRRRGTQRRSHSTSLWAKRNIRVVDYPRHEIVEQIAQDDP
jgi:hypothetical protein